MVDVAELQLNYETFSQLPARLKYNEVIAKYYENLADEENIIGEPVKSLELKANRLRGCSSTWDIDWHRLQGVKGLINAHLCRDRFCVNCLNALSNERYKKFTPMIDSMAKKDTVYHCIFTVKNCSAIDLRLTIKRMFKSFSYFVRYLDKRAKIKNFDFDYLGYRAGIRGLEVTYNKDKKTYHPHLHCLMLLSSELSLIKYIENSFSYSYAHDDIRYFSQEEVLFQKIWYLLNTGTEVNDENISNLDLGYSVVMNKAKREDYHEVFKYAIKPDFDEDKILGYEQFKVYNKSLKGLRMIQGFGDFINFEFDNEDISFDDIDIACEEYKAQLDEIEEPIRVYENADEILDNMKNNRYKYYTNGSIKDYIRGQVEERVTPDSQEVLNQFKAKFE